MDTTRISELLDPFLQPIPFSFPGRVSNEGGSAASPELLSFRAGVSPEKSAVLSPVQLESISTYLDLLLRWNARINLTAVREPEEIVTRHFGESLFAGRCLFLGSSNESLIDFGSGSGFPGLPIKILVPDLRVTLIEANQKKATFLREVTRKLGLVDVNVVSDRAENFNDHAEIVTVRAVEHFEQAMPIAAKLVHASGRLALLIGEGQARRAQEFVADFHWSEAITIPLSSNRILLTGRRPPSFLAP